MAFTTEIRNGMCLNHNNDLWSVIEFQHVKSARSAAFVRTKLKSMTTGKTIEYSFSAGTKYDEVRMERRKYQFLYKDDQGYNFMNNENYDQVLIQDGMIDGIEFLKEGMDVEILFHAENETPLSVSLPPFMILEVVYTEPGIKGDTATNALKPAKLETGAEIKVPLFVNEGDKIKIDTQNRSYIERVKN
ncbi:MAG: elongation factor P [Saprospiraceae bacterium]|jgi:elongation factor P|nr:elongation factor P [Saprospiraceae bacterium]MBK6480507.1 elongation factor P [Saprospiraceae bacterium]MBK6817123.1 elongation factor P [Saprospiraceae bacterium]MBK7371678.1 elongation factor P [Saprospiraceae bacterium]MBK7435849.1 elongation factor P [Saprospiraceae bacterium]